ncbi:MAG: 2'-5' RNA ligase family protein [Nevskiales bacterium]
MAHRDISDIIRAAVWIRPNGAALEQIQTAINEVHRRGGGPRIQAHVTLLGGIETTLLDAESKLKSLAARIQPFTVRLGKLDWRHEYYRCLFATVELSDELATAKRLAHQVFEMNPPEPYEPHLSLMYGDPHGSLKPELATALGNRLDVTFTATTLHLVNASPSVPVPEWRTVSERELAEIPQRASGRLAR